MLIRKLQSRKIAVRVGMSLVVCGLSLNSISLVLTHLVHPLLHGSSEVGDFLHGFLIGIGIALEIAGIVVMLPAVRAARCHEGPASPAPKA